MGNLTKSNNKFRILPAIGSLILPGLGQLIRGHVQKAVVFFIAYGALWLLGAVVKLFPLGGTVMWLAGAFLAVIAALDAAVSDSGK